MAEETQNITLSLPKETLKKVKYLAILRDTSVSGMLTRMLIEMVEREDEYAQARVEYMRLVEDARDLGTHGELTHSREELHERRG